MRTRIAPIVTAAGVAVVLTTGSATAAPDHAAAALKKATLSVVSVTSRCAAHATNHLTVNFKATNLVPGSYYRMETTSPHQVSVLGFNFKARSTSYTNTRAPVSPVYSSDQFARQAMTVKLVVENYGTSETPNPAKSNLVSKHLAAC